MPSEQLYDRLAKYAKPAEETILRNLYLFIMVFVFWHGRVNQPIMNKFLLKKIAKIYAKSLLEDVSLHPFADDLSHDEVVYVVEEINKIANRITSDEAMTDVESIIKHVKRPS